LLFSYQTPFLRMDYTTAAHNRNSFFVNFTTQFFRRPLSQTFFEKKVRTPKNFSNGKEKKKRQFVFYYKVFRGVGRLFQKSPT